MVSETEKEISFAPITPGLGFHPFSDGMPYAPVKPMGTGAVAAGPVRFVAPPKLSSPQIQAEVAAPAAVPSPLQSPVTIAKITEDLCGPHYFSKRVVAYLLDSALHFTLCIFALCVAVYSGSLNGESLLADSFLPLLGGFLLLVHWALTTAQEVAFGTTFGKRALGLRLENEGGSAPFRILFRAFFFLFSTGCLGLGLLSALIDPKKRCWHDRWSGLQPRQFTSN